MHTRNVQLFVWLFIWLWDNSSWISLLVVVFVVDWVGSSHVHHFAANTICEDYDFFFFGLRLYFLNLRAHIFIVSSVHGKNHYNGANKPNIDRVNKRRETSVANRTASITLELLSWKNRKSFQIIYSLKWDLRSLVMLETNVRRKQHAVAKRQSNERDATNGSTRIWCCWLHCSECYLESLKVCVVFVFIFECVYVGGWLCVYFIISNI